jgi:hypothetical protein
VGVSGGTRLDASVHADVCDVAWGSVDVIEVESMIDARGSTSPVGAAGRHSVAMWDSSWDAIGMSVLSKWTWTSAA